MILNRIRPHLDCHLRKYQNGLEVVEQQPVKY